METLKTKVQQKEENKIKQEKEEKQDFWNKIKDDIDPEMEWLLSKKNKNWYKIAQINKSDIKQINTNGITFTFHQALDSKPIITNAIITDVNAFLSDTQTVFNEYGGEEFWKKLREEYKNYVSNFGQPDKLTFIFEGIEFIVKFGENGMQGAKIINAIIVNKNEFLRKLPRIIYDSIN